MTDRTFSKIEETTGKKTDKDGAPRKNEPAVSRNRPRPPRGGFTSAGAAGAITYQGENKERDADA